MQGYSLTGALLSQAQGLLAHGGCPNPVSQKGQARQGRASCQGTQLLTLGAPGNFLFVGGAGWATGHKLWARQSKKEGSTI